MAINLTISHKDPIFIFLYLVELNKQIAENIANLLLNCIFDFYFTLLIFSKTECSMLVMEQVF